MTVTVETIKAQIEALGALKVQLKANREAQLNLAYGNPERSEQLKDDDTRLRNAIYDASQDFSEMFHAAFGIHPQNLEHIVGSHGYVISKKYPIKERI